MKSFLRVVVAGAVLGLSALLFSSAGCTRSDPADAALVKSSTPNPAIKPMPNARLTGGAPGGGDNKIRSGQALSDKSKGP